MSGLRFTPSAAAAMRAAIEEVGGVEVFAIGDVDTFGRVTRVEIHARGTGDQVVALLRRPRAGQVVIHNHTSGVLEPSEPDLTLAGRFGDEGVGVVIVNNPVSADRWVVEPARKRRVPVDPERVRAFFQRDLLQAMGGQHEPREAQLEMALAVTQALNEGEVLVVEAGTGTGKSLAYLVPATLWALANDSKVAVSTFTRTLQAQLVSTDLPLMRRAGLEFSAALMKGRSNYLCRRKLETALREGGLDAELWARLDAWAASSAEGSIQDLGEDLSPELWERVESDADHTLRARCAHYNRCFYYEARRRAAASHLLVVNHALLLADLSIKQQSDGDGVIPRFDRVILDEAHHLEDAATTAVAQVTSAAALRRLVAPLLTRRARPGALGRLREQFADKHPQLHARSLQAEASADELRGLADPALEGVALAWLGDEPKRRVTAEAERDPAWSLCRERIDELAGQISATQGCLAALSSCFDEVEVPLEQAQPLLDLRRAERRLADHLGALRAFLEEDRERCRWVERTEGQQLVRLCRAPVEVGDLLQAILFDAAESVVLTSATLAVAGRFEHTLGRLGLDAERARTATWGSPFRYREQAVLALPRDLPRPDEEGFMPAATALLLDLVRASGGGAFVLCTSYTQVRAFGEALDRALGDTHPILVQGRAGRERLLERFRQTDRAVLVGTDSFWEGVSVRGDALRLVIIPRLPFRVPTEPVAQARAEALTRRGLDPFRAFALPEAVLKLRQGFGRLIRSGTDRGAVVLLDRRVHDMWYGRLFLSSLPDARRITGPARAVMEQLRSLDLLASPGAEP